MLETFTVGTFSPHVGETFRVHLRDAAWIDTELISATADLVERPGVRAPFTVVFRGPPQPVLPQRIYRFEHGKVGAFEMFIVPIGPDASGMRYEAVFN